MIFLLRSGRLVGRSGYKRDHSSEFGLNICMGSLIPGCRSLALLGLDAASMQQFLRLLRWLFTYITILVALPLTCANYYLNMYTTYGHSTTTSSSSVSSKRSTDSSSTTTTTGSNSTFSSTSAGLLDNMQLFTAANITGNGLYVHIMFEWIITCLVILFCESQYICTCARLTCDS
jgi:hypothetical protein